MAKRRMMSLDVIDTDTFMEMPASTQCLYFHLLMRADDDGFVDKPKKILKAVNCSEDDLKVLLAKKYLIPFETGVCVITHWKIHNYIQKDRYKETLYLDEKKQLKQEKNGMYTLCIQSVDTGKDSIELINNNTYINNICDFAEKNFGRTLAPLEYEKLDLWLEQHGYEKLKLALEVCVMNKVDSFRYLETILNNWKNRTLEEIKESLQKPKNEKKEIFNYDWLNDEED